MPTPVGHDGWSRWRRAWAVVSTAGVCLALLSWGAPVVVGAFTLAAGLTMVVHALHLPGTTEAPPSDEGGASACPDRAGTVRAVAGSGAVGGLAAVALAVLGSLSGGLLAAVLATAALTSPPVLARLRRTTAAPTSPDAAEPTPTTGGGTGDAAAVPSARAVRALPDAELCRAWRRSFGALQQTRSTEELERVVVLRRALLDEMELRDPAALAGWLASGARAAGGPERFLRRGRRPESA